MSKNPSPDSRLHRWLLAPLARIAARLSGAAQGQAVPGRTRQAAAAEAAPATPPPDSAAALPPEPSPEPMPQASPASLEVPRGEPAAVDEVIREAPEPDPAALAEPEPEPEVEAEPESEPKPRTKRKTKPRPEPQAIPPRDLVAVPDPEIESLLAGISGVETRLAELSARQADMQQVLQDFQVQQYRVLGDSLAELLRLRHEHARLVAARSGLAEDAEKEQQSARDREGFSETREKAAETRPDVDDETRDELKRLYRSIAMRCHPDRVAQAGKALAHERFQRAQDAYRTRDLAGLRRLLREIDEDSALAGAPNGKADVAELTRTLSAMRRSAADLILAIQTMQLDEDYRRALRRDEWDDYFASARMGFEIECEALRQAIDAL